jgi:hypothetical protein
MPDHNMTTQELKLTPELEFAIDALHRAFRGRKLAGKLEGCPCCASEAELRELSTTPLRELGRDLLESYSWNALWTVGNEDDYRYFAPRLLDLMVREGAFQAEVIGKKLRLAGWLTWTSEERAAIENYFDAFWAAALVRSSWFMDVDTAVCVLGNVFDDLAPFLACWLSSNEPDALAQLAEFAQFEGSSAVNGFISQPFWDERPEQMKQVANWLTSPATLKSLEQRWLTKLEGPIAEALLVAIEAITPFAKPI